MSIEKLEVTFVAAKLKEGGGGILSDPANYITMKFGKQEFKSKTIYD